MLHPTVPANRQNIHTPEPDPTVQAVVHSRRGEVLTAVYLVTAAVVLWAVLLVGTLTVLLFADAFVVVLWLLGGVVAFPTVSLLMRSASQRLADAITR